MLGVFRKVNTQYNLPQSQTKVSQRTAKATLALLIETFAILNGRADAILSIYFEKLQALHKEKTMCSMCTLCTMWLNQ